MDKTEMYQLALVAAGIPDDYVKHIGEEVAVPGGEKKIISPEFLAKLLGEDTLARAFRDPQYKNHPAYKAGEVEINRKAFTDQIKEIGINLAGEGSEFAKELGKKYKEIGVLTSKALGEYARELHNAGLAPLAEKLAAVDKGAGDFLSTISKLQAKTTSQETKMAEYAALIKKLQEEDLPNTRKEVETAKIYLEAQSDIFNRFLMVPSVYDNNQKNGFEIKRDHISTVLLPLFNRRVKIDSDGRGGKKYYLDGAETPYFVDGTRHGDINDVIGYLVRQPQALNYFKASEGGSDGTNSRPATNGEAQQKVTRSNYFS